MKRNLLVFVIALVVLLVTNYFIDSKVLNIIVTGLTSIAVFFGAATICIAGAGVCIPAIGVGVVTFLVGLGLSFQSALAIVLIVGVVLGYFGYKLVKRVLKRRKRK